ncbi:MAG: nucleotidyltransferase family protein [Calothrix sp. MO_167.B42]|nr:nucleotidyltransferase family protein [Calothrix sp. MO_167.B42]
MTNIGLIILAAGTASRMGQPKQLLTYQGHSLIRHVVDMALNSVCQPVVVVLGAYTKQIKPEVENLSIKLVENTNWSEGMSSSIRSGINALEKTKPKLDAVIIALADQPLISAEVFDRLVKVYQNTGKSIVASAYDDVLGVPALFDHTLFSELINLEGDRGAKALIRKHTTNNLTSISVPEAAIDIDTPDDYKNICL